LTTLSWFCSCEAAVILAGDLLMRLAKLITLVSVIVVATSLTQNAYYIAGENPKAWSPAFYLLLLGPIGLFAGIFEWLANPVLLAAWVFSFAGKNKIALLLGIGASALVLAFLFRHTIIANEAGHYAQIIGYGPGYWLWLTSALLVIVSGATGLVRAKIKARVGRCS
jgi:hypothetical protein